jgi:hypothetical protein
MENFGRDHYKELFTKILMRVCDNDNTYLITIADILKPLHDSLN